MADVALTTDAKADETAFPIVHSNGVDSWTQQCGLTKRELFAVMAMQGIISSLDTKVASDEVAQASVMMADALLKELAR